jgi:hypothetical protein
MKFWLPILITAYLALLVDVYHDGKLDALEARHANHTD